MTLTRSPRERAKRRCRNEALRPRRPLWLRSPSRSPSLSPSPSPIRSRASRWRRRSAVHSGTPPRRCGRHRSRFQPASSPRTPRPQPHRGTTTSAGSWARTGAGGMPRSADARDRRSAATSRRGRPGPAGWRRNASPISLSDKAVKLVAVAGTCRLPLARHRLSLGIATHRKRHAFARSPSYVDVEVRGRRQLVGRRLGELYRFKLAHHAQLEPEGREGEGGRRRGGSGSPGGGARRRRRRRRRTRPRR